MAFRVTDENILLLGDDNRVYAGRSLFSRFEPVIDFTSDPAVADDTLTTIGLAPDGTNFFFSTFSTVYQYRPVLFDELLFDGAAAAVGLNALEIAPDGTVYVAGSAPGLFEYTPFSGGATLVAETGGRFSAGDLSLIGGDVYLSASDGLSASVIAFDGSTGFASQQVFTHAVPAVFSTFVLDERLFAVSGLDAYEVDTASGAFTFVTEIDAPGVTEFFDATQVPDAAFLPLPPADVRTVALLYEAGLNRDGNIDAPGLNFWIDARESGFSARQVANAFLRSPEFEAAFGDPLDTADERFLDDTALVEQLYRNVLNREGEAGGVDFWVAALEGPLFDRPAVLLAFANSPENLAGSPFVNDMAETAPGFWEVF
jgi:hypothetical protein